MAQHSPSSHGRVVSIPLEDFGVLQSRYQNVKLAERARMVIADAEPALKAAERILDLISQNAHAAKAFQSLRANHALVGKMRVSEARHSLGDSTVDFVQITRHKLAVWRKTMERVANGEGIAVNSAGKEYIPGSEPVALAIASIVGISNYLSIVQLAIGEVAKLDNSDINYWQTSLAEMRRCATVLSDYEQAACLVGQVH